MVSTEHTGQIEIILNEDFMLFLDNLMTKLEITLQNGEVKSSEICKVMVYAKREMVELVWDYLDRNALTLDELIEKVGGA